MRYLICFIIFLNVVFGADNTEQELQKIFPKNDKVVEPGNCSWKCREVNPGYVTQISGFNFKNGMTYCNVFEKVNMDVALRYNANQQNISCYKELRNQTPDSRINTIKDYIKNFDVNVNSNIAYKNDENKLSLSGFFSALMTLDPNIIDKEKTKEFGEITFRDGIEMQKTENIILKETNVDVPFFGEINIAEEMRKSTSVLDGFNKANMAYFSNLYTNFGDIY